MQRFSFGKLISGIGMMAAFGIVGGVSVALVSEKMMMPDDRARLLCSAGLLELAGEECLGVRLQAGLSDLQDDVAAAQQDRQMAEAALSGRMVFTEGGQVSGLTVIVGAIYEDHRARSGLIRAICWGIQDRNGLDPRLTLAEMDANRVLKPLAVDAFERSAFGLDVASIASARRDCPWPNVQRARS